MSDLFYNMVRAMGRCVFWSTSRPVILHADRVPQDRAFLLASTHLSPFDVPLLIRHTRRLLDFVSVVEAFRNPWVAWFYGRMNAFPLDRSRPDAPTVRIILDRLARGRAVAIFPEGGLRKWGNSVLNGGKMRPGAARLAQMAQVPVIPVVVLNGHVYGRVSSWFPLRHVRYGVIYGEPLLLGSDFEKAEAAVILEGQLREAFRRLNAELTEAMAKAGFSLTSKED